MQSADKSKSFAIPPRWLNCPRKGQLIANRFLPFKTPLDSRYNDQVPEENRFDIELLFKSIKSYNIKLGLIIDLTNTTRFYKPQDLEQQDCRYVKLKCSGHDETPDPDQVKTFIKICDNFSQRNPLQIIGVHCTHGFNRTGFLITAYIVETWGWGLESALDEFTKARPPGIYKQDYLNAMFQVYDDSKATRLAPPLPDWCLESDDTNRDDDGNLISNKSSGTGNGFNPKRKREINKTDVRFMDGLVSGVSLVPPSQKLGQIQATIQEMCEWRNSGFPGAQPVSMDCTNITLLKDRNYKVSWKADGTRYMMLINGVDEVYMADRDNTIYHAPNLTFPKRKDMSAHLVKTLVDGEMIIDRVAEKPVPRYLIYDIVKFEGLDVGKTDFERRLLCINKEIVGPRTEKAKSGQLNKVAEPFSVRAKPFWDLTQTRMVLEGKFASEVTHKTDGLIFQPVAMNYTPGRCDEMLKWKPGSHNTVDFKLKIVRENKPGMLPETKGYLFVGRTANWDGEQAFTAIKYTKELKEYDNKIVECSFDGKQWVFMRQRTDKSFPNSHTTAMAVCRSISQPVTKEMLYEVVQHQRWKHGGPGTVPGPGTNPVPQSQKLKRDASAPAGENDRELMPPPKMAK